MKNFENRKMLQNGDIVVAQRAYVQISNKGDLGVVVDTPESMKGQAGSFVLVTARGYIVIEPTDVEPTGKTLEGATFKACNAARANGSLQQALIDGKMPQPSLEQARAALISEWKRESENSKGLWQSAAKTILGRILKNAPEGALILLKDDREKAGTMGAATYYERAVNGVQALVDMPREMPESDIEVCIRAARQHGEDDDPDHQVGDLQDCVREMWQLMTPEQREAFMDSDGVRERLELGLHSEEFERIYPEDTTDQDAADRSPSPGM
ncbi:hypothetical protein [Ralstonia pseudosolanacearum]|uniref:hypothetical protein n=1 Tax=Ralstonia pseudosolanacearum TaxID=1310165 RepID=UPI003CF50DE6